MKLLSWSFLTLMMIATSLAESKLSYPAARKGEVVEDYHGTKVADPYRWLEDPDSAESRAWIEAENKVTFGYLGEIPEREKIKARLTELWNYERFGVPFKEGGRYFIGRNDGLQNQSVLFTFEKLGDEPRLLLDPNTLSADGTVALKGYQISDDGKFMAYGLSSAGSDWEVWKVRDIATGKDTSDELNWVKFSTTSWTTDGKGFFYSRYDAPEEGKKLQSVNINQKLFYHRLGTAQSADLLVFSAPEHPKWGIAGSVTEDGRYLILTLSEGTDVKNRVFYKDLQKDGKQVSAEAFAALPIVELLNDFDASYDFVGNDGTELWFKTDLKSPKGRVIAIDTTKPGRADWRELVPESAETIGSVNMVNDHFLISYLKDARSVVRVFHRSGRLVREQELPGLGTADGFHGRRKDTETFFAFTSFTTPTSIYRLDVPSGRFEMFRQPKVKFAPSEFETTQVFFASKDGTKIPMFVTRKKSTPFSKDTPCLLYGYGGFNISLTPSFSPAVLAWLDMGGIYALPNLRGGGEYGEEWHQAGTKLRKQNVFDDFIGAAEWLIKQGYTSSSKLAIYGGSNGGLLVGACMTQRPDLYAAAIPAVGVLDMLRFHKFTIGWAWTSDYGSSENADEFKALYAYSPLHNLKPGAKYPATMVTTADHDDRVVPAHSFKFAAALQAAHAGETPALIRIDVKAGHGAGKPTSKMIEEAADRWAFILRNTGMKAQFPK